MMTGISADSWARLARWRIFFGHQSVGNNMIGALQRRSGRNPASPLSVVETRDSSQMARPGLYHTAIGRNGDPLSKNDDFLGLLSSGIGDVVDIALFKYCYVDIIAASDVQELFRRYRQTMAAARERHERLVLVHTTVPLTVVQTGWRAWIKRLIGRPVGGYADNIRRHRFNEMLRAQYRDTEPIFDLAAAESVMTDGNSRLFRWNGKRYPALVSAYTDDGRHLNEQGSEIVAEKLVTLLGGLALPGVER